MDRKIFKLNPEFMLQLQNLVVYCMATGTNIIDHMRQMRLEESQTDASTLILTPEYVEYHNKIVEKLREEITELTTEKRTSVATDKNQN